MGGDRADRIREVAFDLFLERGYEATSIRRICTKAAIEPPTLYHFFGSKKELFFSISDRLWKEYLRESQRMLSSFEMARPDEQLYCIFLISMRFAVEHLDMTRFFLRFSLFPPEELKGEISAFLSGFEAHKRRLADACITECICRGLIGVDLEKASHDYWRFVNNNTFSVVFSQWRPEEAELKDVWHLFVRHRLNRRGHCAQRGGGMPPPDSDGG